MMWKPATVVPENKARARYVWVGLLVAIVGYVVWQIWMIMEEMADPSTSYTLSNDAYKFPYFMVCMEHEFGCSNKDVSVCVNTSVDHDDWAIAEYNNDTIYGVISDEYSNCVGYDLPLFEIDEDEEYLRTAYLEMWWVASPDASKDTTFTESVGIYFGNKGDEVSELIWVPYSRLQQDSENWEYKTTDVTIGKTTTLDIARDYSFIFPALTISTTERTVGNPNSVDDDDAPDPVMGCLLMSITEGAFGLIAIEELNPLEIGTLLGNIGGFWEILLVFWSLMFVATRQDSEPTLRARNFASSIVVGKRMIMRRSRSLHPKPSESKTERPFWEGVYGGSTENTPSPGRQNEGSRRHGLLSKSSYRRPVAFEVPQRYPTPRTSFDSPIHNRPSGARPPV